MMKFKVHEMFGAQTPRALVGSSSSWPQSPVWNHTERVTDMHDGRVLMELCWGSLMIQAFPCPTHLKHIAIMADVGDEDTAVGNFVPF